MQKKINIRSFIDLWERTRYPVFSTFTLSPFLSFSRTELTSPLTRLELRRERVDTWLALLLLGQIHIARRPLLCWFARTADHQHSPFVKWHDHINFIRCAAMSNRMSLPRSIVRASAHGTRDAKSIRRANTLPLVPKMRKVGRGTDFRPPR